MTTWATDWGLAAYASQPGLCAFAPLHCLVNARSVHQSGLGRRSGSESRWGLLRLLHSLPKLEEPPRLRELRLVRVSHCCARKRVLEVQELGIGRTVVVTRVPTDPLQQVSEPGEHLRFLATVRIPVVRSSVVIAVRITVVIVGAIDGNIAVTHAHELPKRSNRSQILRNLAQH